MPTSYLNKSTKLKTSADEVTMLFLLLAYTWLVVRRVSLGHLKVLHASPCSLLFFCVCTMLSAS